MAAKAQTAGLITRTGKVSPTCPEKKLREVEAIAANMALIRDCWTTDAGVWRLVELLAGEPIVTDPFWNPWSSLHCKIRLDGSPGKDGYDVSLWRGFVGANGKHSNTGGWLKLVHAYGQDEKAAAVVPYRGDKWLWDHGMPADLVLHFGRLHYHPPLGLPSSSPAGCTIVPLWLPKAKRDNIHPIAAKALKGKSHRIPVKLTRPNGSEYVREVLVTTGCSSKVADVFGVLS